MTNETDASDFRFLSCGDGRDVLYCVISAYACIADVSFVFWLWAPYGLFHLGLSLNVPSAQLAVSTGGTVTSQSGGFPTDTRLRGVSAEPIAPMATLDCIPKTSDESSSYSLWDVWQNFETKHDGFPPDSSYIADFGE